MRSFTLYNLHHFKSHFFFPILLVGRGSKCRQELKIPKNANTKLYTWMKHQQTNVKHLKNPHEIKALGRTMSCPFELQMPWGNLDVSPVEWFELGCFIWFSRTSCFCHRSCCCCCCCCWCWCCCLILFYILWCVDSTIGDRHSVFLHFPPLFLFLFLQNVLVLLLRCSFGDSIFVRILCFCCVCVLGLRLSALIFFQKSSCLQKQQSTEKNRMK